MEHFGEYLQAVSYLPFIISQVMLIFRRIYLSILHLNVYLFTSEVCKTNLHPFIIKTIELFMPDYFN